jgi:predicted polyphosphate/ATP-dependent NAD kinase
MQPRRSPPRRSLRAVSAEAVVGIVANPASGRDIRRLVAGASVFGNADKAGMVFRLLAGLGASGVRRALMMPAGDGLSPTLARQLTRRTGDAPFAELEELEMKLTSTAADTTRAVELMCAAGVDAIVVLGGDGTHRVVAKACGEVPICALSTGTNNVFPEMREATVAGMATGLVATGRGGQHALVREAALVVERDGGAPDLALIDVAVTRDRFVGARALWRHEALRELFVTFADPGAVGLSSVAGQLAPMERGSGRGLHVRLAEDPAQAQAVLQVALAPGLVTRVAVAGFAVLEPGERVAVAPGAGTLALDGEREIERRGDDGATVHLTAGPRRIDVDAVMRDAAAANATQMQPAAG